MSVTAISSGRVDYVLVGGLALVAHGSSRVTVDLDLCYDRSSTNIERLVRALAPMKPRLRDFPPELPFFWDEQTVKSGLNFTLTSEAGDIDLLGEVSGVGAYPDAAKHAIEVELYESNRRPVPRVPK